MVRTPITPTIPTQVAVASPAEMILSAVERFRRPRRGAVVRREFDIFVVHSLRSISGRIPYS
jgi:hypothetical protein